MIIECPNCNKKFKVESSLIPESGRNIQCGSCNHTWFFRKAENEETMIKPIKLESNLSDNMDEIVINEELDYPKKQIRNQVILGQSCLRLQARYLKRILPRLAVHAI